MAIEERLRRLEEAQISDLCAVRPPCRNTYMVTVQAMPDGTEELVEGEWPPPLCERCPERELPPGKRSVGCIVVVRPVDYRGPEEASGP